MADAPEVTAHGRQAAGDVLGRYLTLIRHAVTRAASRRAAPFKQDIAQTVAVAVWRQLEREQDIAQPSSYVYKAVVRETVRALRREQGRREVSIGDAGVEALRSPADPESTLEGRELGKLVDECLDALAPDRARAVRAHLAGFDVGDTMRLYGWTYQRARNLVARGMSDLRAALRRKGVHP
ncbi:MAG: RNA polymerase sigma factor [Vicinamibacterales bacterium]